MRLKMVQNHVVLLPGLDGTGELFAPFLHAQTNHFDSTVVKYPPDKMLNYLQLIPSIREVVPWGEPYILLAESFSGPLALQFAAVQPENLKAIVLVASFVSNPVHPLLEWARFLMKGSWLEKPLPETLLKKFLMGEDCPPALCGMVMQAIRSVRPEVLAHRIRMSIDTDVRNLLQSCDKPLLYLSGARDKIVARRGLEKIQAVRPDVVHVELDAPHLVLQRCPREAIAAIDQFLEGQQWACSPRERQMAA